METESGSPETTIHPKKADKTNFQKFLILTLLAILVLGVLVFVPRQRQKQSPETQEQELVSGFPEFPLIPNAEVISSRQQPQDGQFLYAAELKVNLSSKDVEDWYRQELQKDSSFEIKQIQEGVINFQKGATIYTIGIQEDAQGSRLLVAALYEKK